MSQTVSKKSFFVFIFTFLIGNWGERWLFFIWDGTELQSIEKGRQSPVSLGYNMNEVLNM